MKKLKLVNTLTVLIILVLTTTVLYQYFEVQRVKKEMGLQILLNYHSMRYTVTELKNYIEKNNKLDSNTLLIYNTKLDNDRVYLKQVNPDNSNIQFTYLKLVDYVSTLSYYLIANKDITATRNNLMKELDKALKYHISIANQFGKNGTDELKCYNLYRAGKL